MHTEALASWLDHLAINLEKTIANILDVVDVRDDLVARDEVLVSR